jgi:AcrR family transcriptional regulator
VPKLWTETIEEHRRSVGEAILDATAALVADQGVASVTMSAIAERTGIGRATLYKYFADVEAILLAWHERQIARHLRLLGESREAGLASVLRRYAMIQYEQHGHDLSGALHRGEHVARAHRQLHGFVRDLLAAAAETGEVRTDVDPGELAGYCLHALTAAASMSSAAAVERLVSVVLRGLDADTASGRR